MAAGPHTCFLVRKGRRGSQQPTPHRVNVQPKRVQPRATACACLPTHPWAPHQTPLRGSAPSAPTTLRLTAWGRRSPTPSTPGPPHPAQATRPTCRPATGTDRLRAHHSSESDSWSWGAFGRGRKVPATNVLATLPKPPPSRTVRGVAAYASVQSSSSTAPLESLRVKPTVPSTLPQGMVLSRQPV